MCASVSDEKFIPQNKKTDLSVGYAISSLIRKASKFTNEFIASNCMISEYSKLCNILFSLFLYLAIEAIERGTERFFLKVL